MVLFWAVFGFAAVQLDFVRMGTWLEHRHDSGELNMVPNFVGLAGLECLFMLRCIRIGILNKGAKLRLRSQNLASLLDLMNSSLEL